MQIPHPRKIFNAIRISISLLFLASGATGMLQIFYKKIIPEKIISLLPAAIYSISRENIILVASFVLLLAGFLFLFKRGE